jgi:hypothetical protein
MGGGHDVSGKDRQTRAEVGVLKLERHEQPVRKKEFDPKKIRQKNQASGFKTLWCNLRVIHQTTKAIKGTA